MITDCANRFRRKLQLSKPRRNPVCLLEPDECHFASHHNLLHGQELSDEERHTTLYLPPPQQVFPVFLRNGKSLFLQTKFLPVGSSLGHLPMKKFFKFVKKIRDNTIKDNVTVTSSNLSRNDGMIRFLSHFLAKNHSKLTIEDINLIQ